MRQQVYVYAYACACERVRVTDRGCCTCTHGEIPGLGVECCCWLSASSNQNCMAEKHARNWLCHCHTLAFLVCPARNAFLDFAPELTPMLTA